MHFVLVENMDGPLDESFLTVADNLIEHSRLSSMPIC